MICQAPPESNNSWVTVTFYESVGDCKGKIGTSFYPHSLGFIIEPVHAEHSVGPQDKRFHLTHGLLALQGHIEVTRCFVLSLHLLRGCHTWERLGAVPRYPEAMQ